MVSGLLTSKQSLRILGASWCVADLFFDTGGGTFEGIKRCAHGVSGKHGDRSEAARLRLFRMFMCLENVEVPTFSISSANIFRFAVQWMYGSARRFRIQKYTESTTMVMWLALWRPPLNNIGWHVLFHPIQKQSLWYVIARNIFFWQWTICTNGDQGAILVYHTKKVLRKCASKLNRVPRCVTNIHPRN